MRAALLIILVLALFLTAGVGVLAWYGIQHDWFGFLPKNAKNDTITTYNAYLTFYDSETGEQIEAVTDLNKHQIQVECLTSGQLEQYRTTPEDFLKQNPQYLLKIFDAKGCYKVKEWLTPVSTGKMLKGYNQFVLPGNQSYIMYVNGDDYYTQMHGFFLDKNKTLTSPLRKFLTNATILSVPVRVQGEQESTINLSLKGEGYYDHVSACLKWTFGITNAWIDWRELDQKPSRFATYDRCFESGIMKEYNVSVNVTVHVKAGKLDVADQLSIVLFDQERRRIGDEVEWFYAIEGVDSENLAAPDFAINITG